MGLQLERDRQRHVRYQRRYQHQQLLLPRLWAGFRTADVPMVCGGGPELTAYCQRIGQSPGPTLDRFRRHCRGLTLYPLPWVSHHWQEMATVFADVAHFAQRQIFPLRNVAEDFIGYQGAAQFDFANSRFRQGLVDHPPCQTVPASIAG